MAGEESGGKRKRVKIHGDFADSAVTGFCSQQDGKTLDYSEHKLCALTWL